MAVVYRTPNTDFEGQMENTTMRKFIQGSNIIALLDDRRLPSFLKPVANRVRRYLSLEYGGTLLDENQAHGAFGWSYYTSKARPWAGISPVQKTLLLEAGFSCPTALDYVVRDGIEVYEPKETSEDNCNIQYKSHRDLPTTTSGRILQIVKGGGNDPNGVRLIVESFKEISSEQKEEDPFRRYPELQARIYHSELSGKPEVIQLSK